MSRYRNIDTKKLDDFAAQEASMFITSIVYNRKGATKKQWDALLNEIERLRSLIYNS